MLTRPQVSRPRPREQTPRPRPQPHVAAALPVSDNAQRVNQHLRSPLVLASRNLFNSGVVTELLQSMTGNHT